MKPLSGLLHCKLTYNSRNTVPLQEHSNGIVLLTLSLFRDFRDFISNLEKKNLYFGLLPEVERANESVIGKILIGRGNANIYLLLLFS